MQVELRAAWMLWDQLAMTTMFRLHYVLNIKRLSNTLQIMNDERKGIVAFNY